MAEQQYQAFVSVWIDGEPMQDFAERARSVAVVERTHDASSFRILMSMAPSNTDASWPLLEDVRFELLRRVTIAFGIGSYRSAEPDTLVVVFDGYVTSVRPYFGPQRVPDSTLEIAGLDASCLMHFESRVREWKNQTDAAIVREIYAAYGFGSEVSDTSPTRHDKTSSLLQRCTDAEFVRMLARRNGFECFLEAADSPVRTGNHPGDLALGHFHAPRLELEPQPALSLTPRAHPSVIDLSARWDSHRPTSIVSSFIDPHSRRIHTARRDAPRLKQLGERSRIDLLRPQLSTLARKATLDPVGLQHQGVPHHASELESFAFADHLDSDWLAEATARVQGLRYPSIVRARRPVTLAGAGSALDGTWYVRSAVHSWTRNAATHAYEVELGLVRNALGPARAGGAGA